MKSSPNSSTGNSNPIIDANPKVGSRAGLRERAGPKADQRELATLKPTVGSTERVGLRGKAG